MYFEFWVGRMMLRVINGLSLHILPFRVGGPSRRHCFVGCFALSLPCPPKGLRTPSFKEFLLFFLSFRNFKFKFQIFKVSNFLGIREQRVEYDLDAGSSFKACLICQACHRGSPAAGFGTMNSNETVQLLVDCNRSTPWSFRFVDVRQQHIKFDLTSVCLLRGAVVVRCVTGDGPTASLKG
jgi:hypothetical protein